MSSKNIKTLDKEFYIKKNEERLVRLSNAYFYKKHFLIGDGVNRDEMNFSTIFSSFLCESNCEINNLIKDKIAGKLEPKRRKKNPIIIVEPNDEFEKVTYLSDTYWDKQVEW